MRRPVFLGIITFVLIVAGLAMFNSQLLILALPGALYLVLALVVAPQNLDLRMQRSIGAERVVPDQPVEIEVSVTNHGSALSEVLVEDILPAGLIAVKGSHQHLLSLQRGEVASWRYTLTGTRGYHTFNNTHAVARDAFGLIRCHQKLDSQGQLFILPEVLNLKRAVIRPRRTRVYSGIVPARVGGSGVEFFGLREYQVGDPPRWINWRASARSAEALYSNQFEQERVADVGIVLDGRLRSNRLSTELSMFEHSVRAAATLTSAFISQGNRVGLLLYGHYLNWTYPGYGRFQQERILRVLAQAELGDSQIFSDLGYIPARLFPTSSQIVLISPLISEDLETLIKLRARDYQVLVVSPDPVAYERTYLPDRKAYQEASRVLAIERELMLQRLRSTAIQVINWDVSVPFDLVIRQHLTRPPAYLRVVEARP